MSQLSTKNLQNQSVTNTKVSPLIITGFTEETVSDSADLVLIYDDSSGSLKKMTRENFIGSTGSLGDISELDFFINNNQSTFDDVVGLSFDNSIVRSFKCLLSVEIDATIDLFEEIEIHGIQKGSDWEISLSTTGDLSLVELDITDQGQIQYKSGNYSGFVSGALKFRAITTSI